MRVILMLKLYVDLRVSASALALLNSFQIDLVSKKHNRIDCDNNY